MYLNDWEASGFFGMVMDFEGVYITESEFNAESAPYSNVEYWEQRKREAKDVLAKEQWQGLEVLLASYGYQNYSGDAFVLFRKDGKLYEVNGSHCSCHGLERQWQPEETTVEELRHRLDKGNLGNDEYCGNKFAVQLRQVLDALENKEGGS